MKRFLIALFFMTLSVQAQNDAVTIPPACIPHDTITALGTKIFYTRIGDAFKLSWGDSHYTRSLDSLYTCYYDPGSGLWDQVPKLKGETKSFLVFTNVLWTSGGANPDPLEYLALLLPKNSSSKIQEKPFYINFQGNYISYADDDNNDIHIQNLETGKQQTLFLYPMKWLSRSPSLAVQKLVIQKDKIVIDYETLKNDDIKIIRRKFKLKI